MTTSIITHERDAQSRSTRDADNALARIEASDALEPLRTLVSPANLGGSFGGPFVFAAAAGVGAGAGAGVDTAAGADSEAVATGAAAAGAAVAVVGAAAACGAASAALAAPGRFPPGWSSDH